MALACALISFLAYLPWTVPGEIMTRSDNFWYVPTAWSILAQGDIELSEYQRDLDELSAENPFLKEYLNPDTDYRIYKLPNGGLVNHYTVGNALAALPLLPLAELPYRNVENRIWKSLLVTPLLAKMYAALAVGMFFLVALELSERKTTAFVATALFAFSTCHAGSHAGGYWSHNTGAFFLLLGIWLLCVGYGRVVWLSALPLTLSLVVRPDMIIVIGAVTLYIFVKHRTQFWRFALLGGVLGAAYLGHCQWVYGEWVQPYQGPVDQVGASIHSFFTGLAGLTCSPSRGLFVFTPILLLSLIGLGVAAIRPDDRSGLLVLCGTVAILHLLFNALWPVWWAGWSYGPRLFAGVIGLWVLLLIPLIEHGRRPVHGLMLLLFLFGVFVQFRCLSSEEAHAWNSTPVNVNEKLDRLWDWSDMQMFRGL